MKVLGIDTDKSVLKKDKHISHIFQIPGASREQGNSIELLQNLVKNLKLN